MGFKMIRRLGASFALTGLLAARNVAAVQTMQSQPVSNSLPVPTSSAPYQVAITEPPPPAPPPTITTAGGITEQAGIGSTQTYGRAGVLELGGFLNFTGASGFTSIQVSPTVGFFVFDNFEVTGILGINYVHQTFQTAAGEVSNHKTIVRVLAEPSYHLPFSRTVWGFLGIGVGVASVPVSTDSSSVGFDIAPRIGANFLVGRSGLISPAFFIDYTTGEALQTSGSSILGVNTTYGLQAGYTVMW
jgi:hypothetical protein